MLNILNSSTISSELLNGAKAADQNAWRMILAQFNPKISVWLARAGVENRDIPDIAQDVWRSVLVSIQNFKRENADDTFCGWLRIITNRRVADYFEAKKQNPAQLSLAFEPVMPADPASDILSLTNSRQVALLKECMDQVQNEVQQLTWLVFQMHVMEEQSVKDVAKTLQIEEHTVYTSKSRVLRRLRELMNLREMKLNEPGN